MRDRLIELLNDATDKEGIYLDKVADYLLANGVIVPPCKAGDTVYINVFSVEILERQVKSIEIVQSGIVIHCGDVFVEADDFGKIAFLTRKEVEQTKKRCE